MCLYGFVKLPAHHWVTHEHCPKTKSSLFCQSRGVNLTQSSRTDFLECNAIYIYQNIKICVPLLAAVTCVSEQGGSAAVGDCVRWAGAMPALVQECLVPCKDDCTFTPWSKFTACSSDCDTTRSRRRSLTGIIFYNIGLIVIMPPGCWWTDGGSSSHP